MTTFKRTSKLIYSFVLVSKQIYFEKFASYDDNDITKSMVQTKVKCYI